MGIKEILKDVGGFIQKVVDYLQSEEGQETVEKTVGTIVEVAKVVVKILLLINNPLSDAEKRELARRQMEFFRECPLADLEKILQAKRDGLLDNLTNKHLDGLVGNVTAIKLNGLKKEAKKMKKKKGKTR